MLKVPKLRRLQFERAIIEIQTGNSLLFPSVANSCAFLRDSHKNASFEGPSLLHLTANKWVTTLENCILFCLWPLECLDLPVV